jgi:hypothetical protein
MDCIKLVANELIQINVETIDKTKFKKKVIDLIE